MGSFQNLQYLRIYKSLCCLRIHKYLRIHKFIIDSKLFQPEDLPETPSFSYLRHKSISYFGVLTIARKNTGFSYG